MEGYHEYLSWSTVSNVFSTAANSITLHCYMYRGAFGDDSNLFHLEPMNYEDSSVSNAGYTTQIAISDVHIYVLATYIVTLDLHCIFLIIYY